MIVSVSFFLNNFEIPKDFIPSESGGGFRVVRKPLLREFVTKRHESIAAQLAGERKGYTPGSRRRPSGRVERRPRL